MKDRPLIEKVFVILGLFSTAALLGVFLYTEMLYKKPSTNEELEASKLKTEGMAVNQTTGISVDKLIVNLNSRTKLKFLNTSMQLIPFKEKYQTILENKIHLIRDIIIDVASNMTAEELNSITGKILFEERIKKRVNETLEGQILKEIYFSAFVIQ